nr:MAG TPA: hypothetical protein [Caudoviricetes sp.]
MASVVHGYRRNVIHIGKGVKKPPAVSKKISPNYLRKHAPKTHDRGQSSAVAPSAHFVFVVE